MDASQSESPLNDNLHRYVIAQDEVFDEVISELSSGEKLSHWMWFIFPQLKGLPAYSFKSRKYSISSREEAIAYLSHPILGQRLRRCTELILLLKDKDISQILGEDDRKFRSSMTLFNAVFPDSIFGQALDQFFEGVADPLTLQLLSESN
jgi:uncharacterized protein (DUF1810 family)